MEGRNGMVRSNEMGGNDGMDGNNGGGMGKAEPRHYMSVFVKMCLYLPMLKRKWAMSPSCMT